MNSEEITEHIYAMYGSGTGVLFGIPSNLRSSVNAIVKETIKIYDGDSE